MSSKQRALAGDIFTFRDPIKDGEKKSFKQRKTLKSEIVKTRIMLFRLLFAFNRQQKSFNFLSERWHEHMYNYIAENPPRGCLCLVSSRFVIRPRRSSSQKSFGEITFALAHLATRLAT
jgi:hypothetical protein